MESGTSFLNSVLRVQFPSGPLPPPSEMDITLVYGTSIASSNLAEEAAAALDVGHLLECVNGDLMIRPCDFG